MSERTRMTLDLSPRLNGEIERLAAEKGTSKADIIRFAIEFLAAALAAKAAGMTIGAWVDQSSGRKEREFIGL